MESGLSIREFCKNEGILEGRFHHWKSKLGMGSAPSSFIPMAFNRQSGSLEIKRNMVSSGKPQPGTPEGSLCEVVYPNGVVLRINTSMSPEALRSLIFLK